MENIYHSKTRQQLLYTLIWILLITSCKPKTVEEQYILPNQWDGGLFSEQPCKSPCFDGITPGITTETMATNIITGNKLFQNCELKDNPNQGRRISCQGLIITLNDNHVVDGIGFRTTLQFTLKDVVIKYGEPTTVWVTPEGTPETPKISMIVLFENRKLRLDFNDQEDLGGTYNLEPSAKVTNIVYYSEANSGLKMFLQPWHGYGKYIIDENSR